MKTTVRFCVFILATSMLSVPALAVDDIGVFEMDGNAVEDDTDFQDWETASKPPAVILLDPPVVHDHGGASIFEGGRKDILDIDSWRWKTGSVPDKDDITHAYAAAYHCPDVHPKTGLPPTDCNPGDPGNPNDGDLVIYFGADRFSNNGDAYLGFWFFKNHVSALPDGTFKGVHAAGDALVLVNFPQASNATPLIRVVEWDPICMKGVKDPQPGECIAKNLALTYDGIVCTDEGDYHDACAVTNTEALFPNGGDPMLPGTIEAPWDYVAKTPDPNCGFDFCFPYESFFEGGINLTELFPEGSCFASFMAETRSSSEFTATLKDFVLRDFPLCSVKLGKTCDTGEYVGGALEFDFHVTVTNTGMAPVSTVDIYDDMCGDPEIGPETVWDTVTDLDPGDSVTLDGTCSVLPDWYSSPVENGTRALASLVTGDPVPVTLDEYECDRTVNDECYVECPVNLSPAMAVDKTCQTELVDVTAGVNEYVAVHVTFRGSVLNTSDSDVPTPLKNVTADDSEAGPLALYWDLGLTVPYSADEILEPGVSLYFGGDYYPATANDSCAGDVEFSDTVTAAAENAYNASDSVLEEDTAYCDLCYDCPPP